MKKKKLSLDLNKRKISNLGTSQLLGGNTIGASQCVCGSGDVGCTLDCKKTKARCTSTPVSEAPTCTLESVDLSFCGSGTVPDTCQSNQVCA
ncbi:hypothetical protein KORDIASMS9_00079 [Kordia sp. SMS9]|uniref:hypothetical protein n=1 Tax=Kordia sp. SMS9 TaxID=2282170 RepID=UPI000E0DB815|nr:hypothetical protein [Kordia sp. SMS9]AXG67897.1 hypothetical protein KORDIASMS9_00079 [Kordia sp. SMS9]